MPLSVGRSSTSHPFCPNPRYWDAWMPNKVVQIGAICLRQGDKGARFGDKWMVMVAASGIVETWIPWENPNWMWAGGIIWGNNLHFVDNYIYGPGSLPRIIHSKALCNSSIAIEFPSVMQLQVI